MRYFAHEREKVAFGVAKKSHPQIMLRHAGEKVWLVFEFRASGLEPLEGRLDVAHLKIQNGTRMIKFRLLGLVEHQADAAAIEKAQLASAKEVPQSKDVAIECGGAIDVMSVDGDLSDPREGRIVLAVHGPVTSMRKVVSIANYIS